MAIDKIDHKTVCGHLKATLAGKVEMPMLQRWIGKLNALSPELYEQVAKDLATVFTEAIQGNYLIPQDRIPHLSVVNTTTRKDREGKSVLGNMYKEPVLNIILDHPLDDEGDYMLSSLSNLKSACVIKTLSRREKDEHYRSIAHSVDIDPQILSEWRDFVERFTPYLIDKLQKELVPIVQYEPIWMMTESSKRTSYIDFQGRLKSANRGDLRSLSAVNMRHPIINRIARRYPDEFASCVLTGFPVLGADFQIPEPLDFTPPIGRVGLAPKRAQKPRIVFIPLAFLDCMSRPAFSKLTQLYVWNVQGVLSHDDSRLKVMDLLTNNPNHDEVWSFDQSAFTDNFDYTNIQRPILIALKEQSILNDYDIAVIDSLNYGDWDASVLRPNKTVKFGCGTGMGTPPSFPLASIGNAYMYAYAYYRVHGKFPDPRPTIRAEAQVVGDDLCIRGSDVAYEYQQFCKSIGLDINMSKSMHGYDVAEFCGKIITRNGIYDKRKLIDITTYAGLADAMDYYSIYGIDEYLESFPEFIPLADQLRKIPKPFGIAEPVDLRFHKPLDSMTSAEVITLTRGQYSDLKSFLDRDKLPSRKDWTTRDARLQSLPHVNYELDISMSDHNSDTKPLFIPEWVNEETRNAIYLYEHARNASLVELIKAAPLINSIYTDVSDFFGNGIPVPKDDRVTITSSKRSIDQADTLVTLVNDLIMLENEPPLPSEGGDDYEK